VAEKGPNGQRKKVIEMKFSSSLSLLPGRLIMPSRMQGVDEFLKILRRGALKT
jgi:hypothetical protein